jgi:catechol 2,3-dioxygenase-like lactoylglutathione lyase family enzyme
MASKLEVESLDHIVLRVRDLERTLGFYGGVLGLPIECLEEYRAGTRPFVSARVGPTALIDLVPDSTYDPEKASAVGGLMHFCLHLRNPDLGALVPWLREQGVEVIEDEPMIRMGARGLGPAIYLRDPDGYIVEIQQG